MLKTKIIATIGPVSDSEETMAKLIKAGATVLRFNLKHGTLNWHKTRVERARTVAKKLKTPIAIYFDLQGPELRIGVFPKGSINLAKRETVAIAPKTVKNYKTILLENRQALSQLKHGITVYLDDAFIELKIVKKVKNYYLAKVVQGGILKSTKGVNLPDLDLELPTLLEKDFRALSLASKLNVDFIGLSFVRTPKDIENLRREMAKRKVNANIIAKIETKAAVKNINEIIDEADAVMVARGDLAVEFDFEKVPYIKKEIINQCRIKGKPVIVATQMLQSMIANPRPTRAEVSDVAEAVYDAADCLMLSEETAGGKYPVKSLQTMAKIVQFIEDKRQKEVFRVETAKMNEVITKAAYDIAQSKHCSNKNTKKIVALTETGDTARLISRFRPKQIIVAVSRKRKTVNQLCLTYGIKPYYCRFTDKQLNTVTGVLGYLRSNNILVKGETVVMTYGQKWGTPGKSNILRIQQV